MVLLGAGVVVLRQLWVVVLDLVVLVDLKMLGSPRLVVVKLWEGGHGWVHRRGRGTAPREGMVVGREVRGPAVVGVLTNVQRHSTSFYSD